MLFARTSIVALLAAAVSVVLGSAPPQRRTGGPGIASPASGTAIAPGQTFNFSYTSVGDYCVSSYNLTVWLFTEAPGSFATNADWAAGHYFGRFSMGSYPGFPTGSPPPAQLVMPDFSQAPGGFGGGASASNQTVYLATIEEYATCSGIVGDRIALASTELIYNGTSA